MTKIFDSIHLSLEYGKYPIQKAFLIFKQDLTKATTHRTFKIVENRWKLAARRFETDWAEASSVKLDGCMSCKEEIGTYLVAASQMLDERLLDLIHSAAK
jgi:hypothetical protein